MTQRIHRQQRSVRNSRRVSRNVYTDSGKKRTQDTTVRRGGPLISMGVLKGIGGILFCAIVICSLTFLLVVGVVQAYKLATTSSFFATEHIDVVGNVRISREMVQDLAGVHVGDNTLAVNIAAVERALLRTPWVEEVSVKRLLPSRFVIRVRERMPSFWIHKDGSLYYADARGVVIAPVETQNFLSLPMLTIEPGSEDEVENLELFVTALKTGRFPVEFGTVSSVHVSPGNGVALYLEDRNLRLAIASADWDGNVKRLRMTLDDLVKRNALGSVREIRAADGDVWVINNSGS